MEVVSRLQDVQCHETRRGVARYVARDADGNEYTTFRESIGESARRLTGQTVRITFHEEQRGQFTNVYLDGIEPTGPDSAADSETDPQEAAWRTAVEAAPWLVGKPGATVEADELYERLKPFEERVEADIERSRRDSPT